MRSIGFSAEPGSAFDQGGGDGRWDSAWGGSSRERFRLLGGAGTGVGEDRKDDTRQGWPAPVSVAHARAKRVGG